MANLVDEPQIHTAAKRTKICYYNILLCDGGRRTGAGPTTIEAARVAVVGLMRKCDVIALGEISP